MTLLRNLRTLRRGALALVVSLLVAHAAAAAGSALEGTVNVNTATIEQLQLLPGIGQARAEQIVSMRKQRGGFKSVDELTDVKGIGDATLKELRGHVTLSGKTTLIER